MAPILLVDVIKLLGIYFTIRTRIFWSCASRDPSSGFWAPGKWQWEWKQQCTERIDIINWWKVFWLSEDPRERTPDNHQEVLTNFGKMSTNNNIDTQQEFTSWIIIYIYVDSTNSFKLSWSWLVLKMAISFRGETQTTNFATQGCGREGGEHSVFEIHPKSIVDTGILVLLLYLDMWEIALGRNLQLFKIFKGRKQGNFPLQPPGYFQGSYDFPMIRAISVSEKHSERVW